MLDYILVMVGGALGTGATGQAGRQPALLRVRVA